METFNPDPKPGRVVLPLVLIGMIATTYTFINRVATNNDLDLVVEETPVETIAEEEVVEDTSTTRSYNVSANVLSFTNAPPTGVLIQVRHIGFAGGGGGDITNLVTTVFGRTGDVVLTNSDDVTIRNLVATGATFSGSVAIGGTLTYEDVKNVDSLGIVTARIGVKVPAGEVTV